MRVLTTTLCYPSRLQPDRGVFVHRRTQALAALPGIHVDVLSPQPWCPVLRPHVHCDREAGVPPVAYTRMLSVPVLGWATDGLAFARAIERHVRSVREPYELIDAHFEYPDGVGAFLAGRRLGIPVVVTLRGKIVSLSRKALRRLQIAHMLRAVHARIAVCEDLARWAWRIGGSDLRVDVIPNGVESDVFYPLDREFTRSRLGWSRQARYVLAVGHQQYVKGFDRLLEVVPRVRELAGDVRFILVGSSRGERWFRRRLAGLARSCNVQAGEAGIVRFVPPVDAETLNLLYNAADVLVCPSRSEGWCNAITEAHSAGLPVVATDVGGNPEQICSNELGTLVPDGDGERLAQAVAGALARDWNRLLISAHSAARDWSQVAQEVAQVFRRVAKPRASVCPVTVQPEREPASELRPEVVA